jgi:hypothetical protein
MFFRLEVFRTHHLCDTSTKPWRWQLVGFVRFPRNDEVSLDGGGLDTDFDAMIGYLIRLHRREKGSHLVLPVSSLQLAPFIEDEHLHLSSYVV